MEKSYGKIKYACYMSGIATAVIICLPALLYLPFMELYKIPFSMLAVLSVINFSMQLAIDLLCSFFLYKVELKKIIRLIPILTAFGLFIFAMAAYMPQYFIYPFLIVGTLIFAVAGGFNEVLISPIIAAIPCKDPEREMSKLHSVYAWGMVGIVIISTVALKLFSRNNWQFVVLIWMIVPIVSSILFFCSELPEMEEPQRASKVFGLLKDKEFLIFLAAIFFGGASECTMSQWSSGYLEYALGIEKVVGDVLGVALFGITLGLGRTLYSKYGRNLTKTLVICSALSIVCYLTAALCHVKVIALLSCALTGLATSILWPGSLSAAAEKFPKAGVAVFALMASGGDFGAVVGSQLVGSISDAVSKSEFFINLSTSLGLSAGQLGMKTAILTAAIFPVIGTIIYYKIHRKKIL